MKLTYKTLNHTFRCSEMTVAQYKDFLKNIYGEDIVLEDFIENFLELFSELSGKPLAFFKELNFYELFVLLIQLRSYTLGEECSLIVTQKVEENKEQKRTIHLNLQTLLQEMFINMQTSFPCIVEKEKISLKLFPPTIKRNRENISLQDEWITYICCCTVNTELTQQTLEISDNKIAMQLIEKLPSILINEAQSKLLESLNQINVNFLELYDGCENAKLTFKPNLQDLLWFCKLFFSESLDTFYTNMFYLSKMANMNLCYLDSCTPGEVMVFITKLQEVIKNQSTESVNPNEGMIGNNESINGL